VFRNCRVVKSNKYDGPPSPSNTWDAATDRRLRRAIARISKHVLRPSTNWAASPPEGRIRQSVQQLALKSLGGSRLQLKQHRDNPHEARVCRILPKHSFGDTFRVTAFRCTWQLPNERIQVHPRFGKAKRCRVKWTDVITVDET